MFRVLNVQRVVIERRQRTNATDQNRHRVRIAAKTLEKTGHLLVHHRVMHNPVFEILFLQVVRKVTVQQQEARLQIVTALGNLLDRIAAIKKLAFITINIGDLRLASGRRHEARIERELTGLSVHFSNVDNIGADRAFIDWKLDRWRAVVKSKGRFAGRSHDLS